jgi:predicted GIY-YIG superfamily endonuclease
MSVTPTELTSGFNWLFTQSHNKEPYVYVLKLADNKYYVGYTEDIYTRLCSHFDGEGSAFTQKYHPISVLKLIPQGSEELEDIVTLEMMQKYRKDNVRGGHWTTINTTGYFPNNNRINNTPIIYCADI